MGINDPVRLARAIERHAIADGMHETQIRALGLYRASAPSEHDPSEYEPSLCIVAQGAKEVLVGKRVYRYDPAHALVVSVDLPAFSRVVEASREHPCLAVRVSLEPAVVSELLADGRTQPSLDSPARGIAVTPVELPLLDAVHRLVTLLESPHDIAALAPLVLREVTYRVLMGPQGSRLRQVALAGAPAQGIAKSIHWFKNHLAEPVKVGALAKRVGMSQSAFHLHFKGLTALSPLQYQKRLRLQEARRLMLGHGLDAAEAAFRVGYESPSQFSREYRRLFGAPPRRDVASLKNEVETTTGATRVSSPAFSGQAKALRDGSRLSFPPHRSSGALKNAARATGRT